MCTCLAQYLAHSKCSMKVSSLGVHLYGVGQWTSQIAKLNASFFLHSLILLLHTPPFLSASRPEARNHSRVLLLILKHYPQTHLYSLQKAQTFGLSYVLFIPWSLLQFYPCLNLAIIIYLCDYCHSLLTELSASMSWHPSIHCLYFCQSHLSKIKV